MTNSPQTIAQLFFGPGGEPPPAMLEAIHSAERIETAKDKLSELADEFLWSDVWTSVCKYMPELFDITLKDIFIGALQKLRELRKYADPEKYPPDKEVTVHLGARTMSSKHRPRLELLVGDIVADELEFQIELKLVLEALGLHIRGGVVRLIDTGHCTASSSVSLNGTEVFRKQLTDFDLPGSLSLGKGIPLNQPMNAHNEPDKRQ